MGSAIPGLPIRVQLSRFQRAVKSSIRKSLRVCDSSFSKLYAFLRVRRIAPPWHRPNLGFKGHVVQKWSDSGFCQVVNDPGGEAYISIMHSHVSPCDVARLICVGASGQNSPRPQIENWRSTRRIYQGAFCDQPWLKIQWDAISVCTLCWNKQRGFFSLKLTVICHDEG